MPYFAPFIDASGLNICTYQDVEDYFVAAAKATFGDDIVLDASSQDFQDIAARAQAYYDALLGAQKTYNDRSPTTATGAGLASLVSLNGLVKGVPTFSIVPLTLTGTPFTLVTNGVVADIFGNNWILPASVTIGSGGTVTATATCETAGAISATVDQIILIQTPTAGWTSVTNLSAATPGQPIETDSALQGRQAASVANPSQALTTGIKGGVLAVTSVLDAQIYENDLGDPVTQVEGVAGNFPAHSITLVVDGGADLDVANAIALRKTPGCYTDGDVSVVTYDTYGVPKTIRFYRPDDQTIDIAITVKTHNGYNSSIAASIKSAVAAYINSLTSSQAVYISEVNAAAMAVNTNPRAPFFSIPSGGITMAINPASLTAADIIMNFKQKAVTTTANITINET